MNDIKNNNKVGINFTLVYVKEYTSISFNAAFKKRRKTKHYKLLNQKYQY